MLLQFGTIETFKQNWNRVLTDKNESDDFTGSGKSFSSKQYKDPLEPWRKLTNASFQTLFTLNNRPILAIFCLLCRDFVSKSVKNII